MKGRGEEQQFVLSTREVRQTPHTGGGASLTGARGLGAWSSSQGLTKSSLPLPTLPSKTKHSLRRRRPWQGVCLSWAGEGLEDEKGRVCPLWMHSQPWRRRVQAARFTPGTEWAGGMQKRAHLILPQEGFPEEVAFGKALLDE